MPGPDGKVRVAQIKTKDESNGPFSITTRNEVPTCILYKRRWSVLVLYMFCAATTAFQCFQYTIIADVMVKFYNVPYSTINTFSTVCLLLYVVLFFPGMYALEKLGLRYSMLLSMLLNVVGAWIKVLSVDPDKYCLLILGTLIVSAVPVIVHPFPPKLASTWFGPKEVSTACSLGTVGMQIGGTIAMVFPPLILSTLQNLAEMQDSLETMAFVVAGCSTIEFVLIFFFFQEKPPTPPSPAEVKIAELSKPFILKDVLKRLLLNSAYGLIVIASGLGEAVHTTVLILLIQIVLNYFPAGSQDAGFIGLTMPVSGIIGSIICGIVLDKYRNYTVIALVSLTISFLTMASFSFLAPEGMFMIYVLCAILAFCLRAIPVIAFEAVAEVTYPEPLSISSGILSCFPVGIAGVNIYLYSYLLYNIGHVYANLAMSAILLVAIILMACVRMDLKRHNAQT